MPKHRLSGQVAIPQIPRAFIKNDRINQVLHLTVNEFNYEEKTVIHLYCLVNLSIEEIAALTKLSPTYVKSTLVLYSEKLAFKLEVFKKAVAHDATDLVPIAEVLDYGKDG